MSIENNKNIPKSENLKNHIRITLSSRKLKSIERICQKIISDNNDKDLLLKGPIRMPTKILKITTRNVTSTRSLSWLGKCLR